MTTGYLFPEELLANIELTGIKEAISVDKWGHYSLNGKLLPRVSDILSSCIDSKDIIEYAAKSNPEFYRLNLQEALNTGTMTHAMIEDYLVEGNRKDTTFYLSQKEMSGANGEKAINSFNNFINWQNYMKSQGYQINTLATEKVITCPWYGGTCDYIAEVIYPHGKKSIYILDFKTSAILTFNYFIQTMLYLKAYNYNKYIGTPGFELNIDGIGLIRLDKTKPIFQYLILDNSISSGYMSELDQACNSIIDWFYYQKSVKYQFIDYKEKNKIEGDIYGVDI